MLRGPDVARPVREAQPAAQSPDASKEETPSPRVRPAARSAVARADKERGSTSAPSGRLAERESPGANKKGDPRAAFFIGLGERFGETYDSICQMPVGKRQATISVRFVACTAVSMTTA